MHTPQDEQIWLGLVLTVCLTLAMVSGLLTTIAFRM